MPTPTSLFQPPLYTLHKTSPIQSHAIPLPDRPLKAGETILEVEPLAVVPLDEGRCERCLRFPRREGGIRDDGRWGQGELRMCGKCRCVGYCSEACKVADAPSHQPLCPSLPSLTHHITALLHASKTQPPQSQAQSQPRNGTPRAQVQITKHDILTVLLVAKILARCCNPSTEIGRKGLALVKGLVGMDVGEIRNILEPDDKEEPGVVDTDAAEGKKAKRPDVSDLDPSFITLLNLIPITSPLPPSLTLPSQILSAQLRFSPSSAHPSIPPTIPPFLLSRLPSNAFILSDAWAKEIGYACVPEVSRGFDHSCGGVGGVVGVRWGGGGAEAGTLEKAGEGRLIVSVRTIKPVPIGLPITITYLDPILSHADRKRFLDHRYGFECVCSLCELQEKVEAEEKMRREREREAAAAATVAGISGGAGGEGDGTGELDSSLETLTMDARTGTQKKGAKIGAAPPGSTIEDHTPTPDEFMRIFQLAIQPGLRKSIGALLEHHSPGPIAKRDGPTISLPSRLAMTRLPRELLHCLDSRAVTELTTLFSDASNGSDDRPGGDWNVASIAGAHVLAVYVIVYGWRWPLTGLHLLELSKVIFNAYVSLSPGSRNDRLRRELLVQCRVYLAWAEESLKCSGALEVGCGGGTVGDDGPAQDLAKLKMGVEGDLREVLGR